jgi:hypothetical protein
VVENSASGIQSSTNTEGAFIIAVKGGDRIQFSRLGYVTQSIQMPPIPANTVIRNIFLSKHYFSIPEVEIRPKLPAYEQDSLEERTIFGRKVEQKQAKFGMEKFKYMKGALIFSSPLSAPIEHFSPKYKRLRAFQERFKKAEQLGFIETRYTLTLITRITGLKNDSLIAFRNQNPLPYELAAGGTDLEIMMWIKDRFKKWARSPYVPEFADSVFARKARGPG